MRKGIGMDELQTNENTAVPENKDGPESAITDSGN